ncbi:MAG: hypothetical protein KKH28_10365, partial [Elusimicrobia bacterium]|nr:hypothetical protein [Elusimicrobiota bacterium]
LPSTRDRGSIFFESIKFSLFRVSGAGGFGEAAGEGGGVLQMVLQRLPGALRRGGAVRIGLGVRVIFFSSIILRP